MENHQGRLSHQEPQGDSRIAYICKGAELYGNLFSTEDMRIDGTLFGSINSSAKIYLGQHGLVVGDITCPEAEIEGKVKGILVVHENLQLLGDAIVDGEILAARLKTDPNVIMNGRCNVGGKVDYKSMADGHPDPTREETGADAADPKEEQPDKGQPSPHPPLRQGKHRNPGRGFRR